MHRRALKLFIFALHVLGVMALANGAAAQSRGANIILLTVSDECTYCARHRHAFMRMAEELGMQVQSRSTPFDPALQAQQVEWAIAEEPDAIVLWPAVLDAIVPSLQAIHAAGVPLVLTNSKPDETSSELWDVYTGPNDVVNGELAADGILQGLAAKGRGDTGRILMIEGPAGTTPQIERAQGFQRVLSEKAADIQVVSRTSSQWNTASGAAVAAALFAEVGTEIAGIYGQDDNLLAGAIDAARDAGIDPDTLVLVGSDCNAAGVAGIRSGVQYASVLQSAVDDGQYAARAAADLLDGKALAKDIYLPHVLVTRENLSVCEERDAQ